MPPGQSQSFSAHYDSTTKLITVVVSVLLTGVVIATTSIAAALVAAVLLVFSFAWSPRGYSLQGRSILVTRLAGNACIPLDGIRELRRAKADDFRGCIRLFGNGGVFGYYGLFRTSKLGTSTWYVTNRDNAVVLIAGAKTWVISPDDVEGLLLAIRSATPVLIPATSPITPGLRQSSTAGVFAAKWLGIAIGIIAVSIVAFGLLYAPGPPDYTLTSQTLTIHDHFYPVTVNAATVDVEHIRVVDFDVDTEWRPTVRTNGFASSHYRSGWFRVAGGGEVRMYRAGSRRLVLLPPKGAGTPVLLETKDPEKFIIELREKWSAHPS